MLLVAEKKLTKYIFMTNRIILAIVALLSCTMLHAQPADRWQQRAEYAMEIDMDTEKHQYKGKQTIMYYNNSPDELDKVFYHLYYNAFQPGSMMDERSRTISDPDSRVGNRISKLKPDEIGFQQINSLTQNGKAVKYKVEGTILEVTLHTPIEPNGKAVFEMDFLAQIPLQIRRTGRMNKEGIDYSMSQWYPKLCEYDYQGWHANPYVGREFHGIWGDFDVKITIDNNYVLGGSGYLQNPNSVGYGYQDEGVEVKHAPGGKLTWHFKAPQVHDFFWGADPDYTHTKMNVEGVTMHFLYQENAKTKDNWEALPKIMATALPYMNKQFGKYPYKQYSFVQGGDGGMEYPMGTLITGERSLGSLTGVSVHEWFHSWYQMVLAFNEALYPWMDEGFTTYGTNETMDYLKRVAALPGKPTDDAHPFMGAYKGYMNVSQAGMEEPLSTHADHFTTNTAYGIGSYSKGCVFLNQLQYIVGKEVFYAGMRNFYETWKFKHPNVNDFIRVMEKESGLELDWYKEYWVNSTHTIDYAVKKVNAKKKETVVELEKIGVMPMPVDVVITTKKGQKEYYTIPLRIMRGEKMKDGKLDFKTAASDWPWTHTNYELVLPMKAKKITKIEIDPSQRMADMDRENNVYEKVEKKKK